MGGGARVEVGDMGLIAAQEVHGEKAVAQEVGAGVAVGGDAQEEEHGIKGDGEQRVGSGEVGFSGLGAHRYDAHACGELAPRLTVLFGVGAHG